MTQAQVEQLAQSQAVKEGSSTFKLIETHISWLLLGPEHVLKIKKPVQYSFLDFSTIKNRKYYCQEEVRLNRRLSPSMYLGVIPIRAFGGKILTGDNDGEIIDYAVLMRRMDERKQMDLLLQKDQVSLDQIGQIAEQLAQFHLQAKQIKTPVKLEQIQTDFADVLNVKPQLQKLLGAKALHSLDKIVDSALSFLEEQAFQLYVRKMQGWTVDGHGDLHARNIFLLDGPVIFDCIEFGDHFREVDVLDELAFLCMDLNFYDCYDLEEHFLQVYLRHNPCMTGEIDRQLFLYYKLYRANVRFKVELLQAAAQDQPKRQLVKRIRRYFELMKSYQEQLQKLPVS
ncbi:MAG: phosphotransferase [Saprospiraceae bacterium]|nr:phosphotransferase [Saprospiraceae bacterium]